MNKNTAKTNKFDTFNWLRYGLAGLIFCVGVILTLGVANTLYTFEKERLERETERLINSHMISLQRNFDLTLESIQSMSAYIGALGLIRQEAIKQYTQDMHSRQGIVTVAWVPWVLETERAVYELTVSKQDFANFSITERDKDGTIIKAKQRGHYFPLTYMTPTSERASVPGYDMGSETDWLNAMEQARDKGMPVTTSPLLFEPLPEEYFQIGIFQPVYHGGLPNQLAARRANLRGFIFVTLDIYNVAVDVLKELIEKEMVSSIKIMEIDLSSKHDVTEWPEIQQGLYSGLFSHQARVSAHPITTTLTIAGHDWHVLLTLAITSQVTNNVWGILVGGLLLTLLLVAYLLKLMERTTRVERLVAERTRKLEESEAHLIQSEKMASIGQMVAGIVHEINTPLAYVRSSVELTKDHITDITKTLKAYEKLGTHLKSDGHTQTASEQLEMAIRLLRNLHDDDTLEEARLLLDNSLHGLDKISNLVKNLRNFSRLDRAKTAEHNLNQGLDDALVMINHMLDDKIRIVKQYGDIPSITCSPAQINQVLLNLLVNAIQAVQAMGKEGELIELVTQTTPSHVQVIIKDNGKGIEKENLKRIFQPFFTTKKSGKGTGLGLAIAHKIIQEHHGDIQVESTINQGTQFTLLLPLTQDSGEKTSD